MTHSPAPAFAHYSGPRDARMVLVGEAWGESEAQLGKPFVGESGKELWLMLGEAMPDISPELHAAAAGLHKYGLAWVREREGWLHAASIGMTNVLALRPPNNKLEELCDARAEVGVEAAKKPAISHGKYLREEFLPELSRLEQELLSWQPNLVVALGNTACWALLQATNIGSIRGTVAEGHLGAWSGKVLPTYHPAGVLRQWSWRPIVVADLMKARRESQFAEIRRPSRTVIVDPTIEEVYRWTWETIHVPPPVLAADTETGAGMIKCISFARSRSESICIPFVSHDSLGRVSGSYWPDARLEALAWNCVATLLESNIPKVWQNGMYDFQYILPMAISPRACLEDTMLLHHSLFPELQKGLGFLGSIYTNEASWKLMRRRKADTEKRDE